MALAEPGENAPRDLLFHLLSEALGQSGFTAKQLKNLIKTSPISCSSNKYYFPIYNFKFLKVKHKRSFT